MGTRKDTTEAFNFVERGLVKSKVQIRPLDNANEVLEDLRCGQIEGRIVFKISNPTTIGTGDYLSPMYCAEIGMM